MALFSKDPAPAPRSESRATSSPAGGGTTVVGPHIAIEGTITGSEPMLIEGMVRGRIDLQSDLRIGTKGRIEATIHARTVTIEGRLTGDVSADERVELVATASVEGNIKAPKIVVADGAHFRGAVDMGSARPNASAAPDTARAK